MCSLTAISGPAFGSVSRCGATTRLIRSPRYPRAARIDMTWVSLVNRLATSRSRAVTSASTVAYSSGITLGTVFIANTNSRNEFPVTKSMPRSTKACTGGGAPARTRASTSRTLRPA